MALASIHSGTITGKLNGVMPATTPTGCEDRVDVDAGRHLGADRALQQLRDAAGELDALEAAGDLAEGVGAHLAVLAGDEGGELVAVPVEQLAEAEHGSRPAG